MPSNPNQLVELKVAGRYRMLPVWATKLSFEVRPGLKFDSRAWKLWKPCLLLLEEIVKKEKLKVSWVRIHSHFGLKGDIPHAMGWWDHEQKAMFLCHFDKETLLHEVGHALYTTLEEYSTKNPHKDLAHFAGYMNVLEDVRIEKLMKRRYPGLRKSFNAGYKE